MDGLLTPKYYPKVGVVILNYQGAEYTINCVFSFLKKIDYPNYQILIIDCGSQDNSLDKIKNKLKEVDVLLLSSNKGYTGGNNAGAEWFIDRGCDYIHIINNDILVYDGSYLSKLVNFMEENHTYGVVGPTKIITPEGLFQSSLTWIPSLNNRLLFHLGYSLPLIIPNGVCLLIRSEVIKKIGLFDETYFMYGEEEDFCERVIRAGWRTGAVETESIVHFGSSIRKLEGFGIKSRLSRRNKLLFLKNRKKYLEAFLLSAGYLACATTDFIRSLLKKNIIIAEYFLMVKVLICFWFLKPEIGPKVNIIKGDSG
jgi:GT2 family glycosyltransferase